MAAPDVKRPCSIDGCLRTPGGDGDLCWRHRRSERTCVERDEQELWLAENRWAASSGELGGTPLLGKPIEEILAYTPIPDERVEPSTNALEGVIAGLLEQMDDIDRDVVLMTVTAGMSVRAIAAALGLSKSDVQRRKAAGLDRLAEMFENSPEIKEYMQR